MFHVICTKKKLFFFRHGNGSRRTGHRGQEFEPKDWRQVDSGRYELCLLIPSAKVSANYLKYLHKDDTRQM